MYAKRFLYGNFLCLLYEMNFKFQTTHSSLPFFNCLPWSRLVNSHIFLVFATNIHTSHLIFDLIADYKTLYGQSNTFMGYFIITHAFEGKERKPSRVKRKGSLRA